jgi:hypothetical protein
MYFFFAGRKRGKKNCLGGYVLFLRRKKKYQKELLKRSSPS